MNAIAKHQAGALVSTDQVEAIRTALKTSLYPGAADASVDMVLSYCQAAGLDPMTKPVHIVPMWDSKASKMRDVVMPGIGLYRIQAARSGELAGISEPEFGPIVTEVVGRSAVTFPEWCRVTVKRQLRGGTIAEFSAVEFWMENYAIKGGKERDDSPNAMWMKRPRGQLAKCAQAQALRMAFPEIGSAPTAEEMEGKSIIEGEAVTVPVHTAEVRQLASAKPYPAADFEKNFPTWRGAVEAGHKTAEQIITMVETKGALTDEQKNLIRNGEPKPAAPENEAFPLDDEQEVAA